MEIMLSHLGIGMAYDALDGLDIHAQRLHLRYIGVASFGFDHNFDHNAKDFIWSIAGASGLF